MKLCISLLAACFLFLCGCTSTTKDDPQPDKPIEYMRVVMKGSSRDWKKMKAEEKVNQAGSHTVLSITGSSDDGAEFVSVVFAKPVTQTWETTTPVYVEIKAREYANAPVYTYWLGTAEVKYDASSKLFTGTFFANYLFENGAFQVKRMTP